MAKKKIAPKKSARKVSKKKLTRTKIVHITEFSAIVNSYLPEFDSWIDPDLEIQHGRSVGFHLELASTGPFDGQAVLKCVGEKVRVTFEIEEE